MTDFKCIYVVYMDNNTILGTSTVEEQAYELIRTEATIHRESEFKIKKTETVFDSVGKSPGQTFPSDDPKSKKEQTPSCVSTCWGQEGRMRER